MAHTQRKFHTQSATPETIHTRAITAGKTSDTLETFHTLRFSAVTTREQTATVAAESVQI